MMDSSIEKPASVTKITSATQTAHLQILSPCSIQKQDYLRSPVSTARKHSTTFTTSFVQTPSGPVLTPNGDFDRSTVKNSTTMILLSPSRTIADSLTSLASSTAQQLEQVWDEVGYNPEERASQLSDLLRQFRNLCDEKISEERGVADTFRSEIQLARQELEELQSCLKKSMAPNLEKMASHSLTDQLSLLEQSLEAVREEATLASNDLTECRQVLIESHKALGLPLDENYMDIESDLTMTCRKTFHAKVTDIKQQVTTRTNAVVQLLQNCQHLMHELRIEEEEMPLDRRIAGSLVRSKDGSFMLASKLETETCVGIGPDVLEELSQRVARLTSERKVRKARLQQMGTEIATMWEKLRISDEEQQSFTRGVQGLGMDTIAKGEEELRRLHTLKGEMLNKLILEARNRILVLWNETNTTQEQQMTFSPFNKNNESHWNDDLLDQHDDYISSLETRLEQMKPILRIVEKREEILAERMEYEELQHNSERLNQRGAGLAKQLMREEKMAKRIKRELPKLTIALEEKLLDWKREHGEDFQVGGEVYLDVMRVQEIQWKQYKDNESKAKLKKKQEERALTDTRFSQKSNYKAVNGKKKVSIAKTRRFREING
mmetsp:Transcript_22925/g.26134  ORF Transcript_22925/g.26134 Transcript_22925/m.26134 type:complete len:607 (+) Transcript_22925:68-1888(+)